MFMSKRRSRGSRPVSLGWPFFVIVAVVIAVPAVLALADVPGENDVKDALGILQKPTGQECGEVRDAGRPNGPWRAERALDSVRDEARAARIGDSVYLVGGIDSLNLSVYPGTASSLNTFERYDVKSRRYTSLPPLPRRLNHVAVVAYRGDIYAVGGFNDQLARGEATGDAWRYRPAELHWERIASMPTKRGGHGAAVVGHRMYVVGGRDHFDRPRRTDVYDFRTGRWSRAASLPTARDHLGVGEYGGKIYVAGGRDSRDFSLGTFERYDPAADRWVRLSDIPGPASSFDLEKVSGKLVASGGGDSKPPQVRGRQSAWVSGQTWAYDPEKRNWSRLSDLPQPKHGYASAAVGDRLYLFGGSRCGGFRATDTAQSLHVPRS